MTSGFYPFDVGYFECIAISDGTSKRPPEALAMIFSTAPQDELERALREHHIDPDNMENQFTCLIVKSGAQTALIDAGLGTDGAPDAGKLVEHLRAAGLAPDGIDLVMITHAHGDHIGGLTNAEGDLTFGDARHVMWRDEWAYWTANETLKNMDERRARAVKKNLLPLEGRIELIDSADDIAPGIGAFPLPGHTPGHMALSIVSEGEQLIYSADTVLHPLHLEHPDWSPSFDSNPAQAVESRRKLGRYAVAENSLVLAYHFPFPGLGQIVAQGDVWGWQPLEAS